MEGIPQPTVTWMKDGRPLTKGRGMEVTDEGHILQLKNVHVSDTGRYVCVAVNIAGMTDRKYDLSVHSKYKQAQYVHSLAIASWMGDIDLKC